MKRLLEDCEYRHRVRPNGGTELADCLLLEMITGAAGAGLCTVRRDACEACCETFEPRPGDLNPVTASLLYKVTDKVIDLGGVPGCDLSAARRMQVKAEANLSLRLGLPAGAVACDVVICCSEASPEADRAVQSALDQRGAHIFLHLVDDGGGGSELVRRYAGRSHVHTYRNPTRKGTLRTLHTLVPRLRSAYVAVQVVGTISTPERIRNSVAMLEAYGGEFLGASVRTPAGLIRPAQPRADYRRFLPLSTMVCRRASLVDMGGIADRPKDADAELIFRAFMEARNILLSEEPLVVTDRPPEADELGPSPRYHDRNGSLRHHAIGFHQEPVQCDVVLPFYGHTDFVAESLPSVLEQCGAETIVHLIDDATPGGAPELVRYWSAHPRVRIYRNSRNLGQFVSFNNVFPFLETDLLAIQDADDISLPNRIHIAGNHLRLADADFFGGRFETFEFRREEQSDDVAAQPDAHPLRDRPPYWASEYPMKHDRTHFLQNTTVVMRKGSFESLRGFSDYGDVNRNKCGLDTEFFVRAHRAGCRFVMTHDVVVRYRWHRESATRNAITGWGSAPRDWSAAENERRFKLYDQGPFDPRALGTLHRYWGLTHRIN
jgi:glycosyltransferase involved in cell wall biosynthesis